MPGFAGISANTPEMFGIIKQEIIILFRIISHYKRKRRVSMTGRIRDFSMDIFSLQGKVAIITGANQGLGMGYAYALAKAGDIFIPHLTPNIAEIREMITGLGRVEFLQEI